VDYKDWYAACPLSLKPQDRLEVTRSISTPLELSITFYQKSHHDLTDPTRRNAKKTMKKFVGTPYLYCRAKNPIQGLIGPQRGYDFRRGSHNCSYCWEASDSKR
jgi:hypothetical protein